MKCCATLMSRVRVPCSLLGPTGRSAPSGRQGTQIAPKWRNNTAVSGSENERHTLVGHRWPISAHFLFRTSGVRPRSSPSPRDTFREHWQVSAIKLITVLRGFKNPVAVLDRFLEASRVEPTDDHLPFYHRSEPDAGSSDFSVRPSHSRFRCLAVVRPALQPLRCDC